MTIRTGVWPYFWHDPVTQAALAGYTGALVRAANGDGVTAPDGTNFRNLWHTAVAAVGPARCDPWTYLYPSSDGAASARALFGSTGPWRCFQVDLEDAVPPAVIQAFCGTLRALSPGTSLIFDSYPSRAQFIRVNGPAGAATWDTAMRLFDAFNPQIYYPSQSHYDADADGIPDYVDDALGKPVLPAISVTGGARPASWPDVISGGAAQAMLDRFGTLALWRYPDSNAIKGKLTYHGGDDMTAAEVWSEQVPVPAIFKTRFASSSYTMAEILYGARLLAGDAVTAAKALVPVLDDQGQIVAAVNAVTGHVGDSEAAVLAALALVAAPTLTQAQLDYLASKFPAVDPQKIADAVHADIGKAFEPPA